MTWMSIDVELLNPEVDLWESRRDRIEGAIREEIQEIYDIYKSPVAGAIHQGITKVLGWFAEDPKAEVNDTEGGFSVSFSCTLLGRPTTGSCKITKPEE